jgi:hypothetical protein
MASTITEAVDTLSGMIQAIVPLIEPGRRFSRADSNDDEPGVSRSFAVWPRQALGLDEFIAPGYTAACQLDVVIRYAMGADLGAARRRAAQDALQIIVAISTPPLSTANPWLSCDLVSHETEERPETATMISRLVYRLVQEVV